MASTNNFDSLAPLLTYLILREATDTNHPLTQVELRKKLEDVWGLKKGRKAFGKMLQKCADSEIGVRLKEGRGVWYQEGFFFEEEDYEEDEDSAEPEALNVLAPLFIWLILEESSNKNHLLDQKKIMDKLDHYPYGMSLRRQAVSRWIHTLTADSRLGIHYTPGGGAWYQAPRATELQAA